MKKRLLAGLLSVMMLLSMLPISALAADDPYAGYTEVAISSSDNLRDKIESAENKTKFVLADGNYTLPADEDYTFTNNPKQLAFTGSPNAVIKIEKIVYAYGLSFAFDGVTVTFPDTGNTSDYIGLAHIGSPLTYTNCKINGKQTLYSEETVFTNCTFENKQDYCIWTWAASDGSNNTITFTDCTFNTGGKGILVYSAATTSNYKTTVNLNNCKFYGNGTVTSKAAVETGSDGGNTGTSNKYTITFNNCTATGFVANNGDNTTTNLSNSPLWGNKNGMDNEHLTVHLDGVEVTHSNVHLITFDNNGTISTAYTSKDDGKLASLPTPSRPGYTFAGWYDEAGNKVTGDTVYTEDTTLTARWDIIIIIIPTPKPDPEPTPDPEPENPFTDVSESDWFYEDVLYVYENGLMEGTGQGLFSPDKTLNRATVVTTLWRLAGSPVVETELTFSDLEEGQWYTEPMKWAIEKGIILGYGNGTCKPLAPVTHEQACAIFQRYAAFQGKDTAVPEDAAVQAKYSPWAEDSVLWAAASGLLEGIDLPDLTQSATRAHVAAYLHRLCTLLEAE